MGSLLLRGKGREGGFRDRGSKKKKIYKFLKEEKQKINNTQ